MDYTNYTVVELKALVKERKVLFASNCKKKADYVAALVEDDNYKKSMANFHTGLQEMSTNMQKNLQSIKDSKESINEKIAKIRETCNTTDIKIKSLKYKEDKTIDDYKTLVDLMEKRMKLMKDF